MIGVKLNRGLENLQNKNVLSFNKNKIKIVKD